MPPPAHMNTAKCRTALQEIADGYEGGNTPYFQNTRPNHSVGSIQWDLLAFDATNARAWMVARKGQQLNFFGYGIASSIALSGDPTFKATTAETNIVKANETNNDDFAILWIGCSHRGNKVSYPAGTVFNTGGVDTDPTLLAAMLGRVAYVDPFSYRTPAEFGSPALLENAEFQELIKYIELRFEWDNGVRTEKVGLMSQYTEGGGASYLHANGEPSTEARTLIPEGYKWTRAGTAGSQFNAFGILTQDVVTAVSTVTPIATAIAPDHLYTEIMLRLGGVHFLTPSGN